MPLTPTPDPTNEQFLELLPTVDHRLFAAQFEIIRRLRVNVPGKIAALNTRLGYASGQGIPLPRANGYLVAPHNLTDKHINTILVAASAGTQALAPGVFQTEAQVVVYSINERFEIEEQVKKALERAGVIRGILAHFLTGCVDPGGRMVWRLLEPQGVSMLPQPWESYSGVACYYRMLQTPDESIWT